MDPRWLLLLSGSKPWVLVSGVLGRLGLQGRSRVWGGVKTLGAGIRCAGMTRPAGKGQGLGGGAKPWVLVSGVLGQLGLQGKKDGMVGGGGAKHHSTEGSFPL